MSTLRSSQLYLFAFALSSITACAQAPQDDSTSPLGDTDSDGEAIPGEAPEPPPPQKKNILLFILDDVGVDNIQAYGEHTQAPATTNISSLASSGMLFRNVWANPVCSPTRAGIYTGRHGFRTEITHVLGDNDSGLDPDLTTIADVLSTSYKSGLFGKWHLGDRADAPFDAGFDYFAGSLLGSVASEPVLDTDSDGTADTADFCSWKKYTRYGATRLSSTSTKYATTANVDDAWAWIQARQAESKPWMATVAFNAAHDPYHFPPSASHPRQANGLCDASGTDRDMYVSEIQKADSEIGRLLGLLGSTLSNTVVIVVGDNGTPGGQHGVMISEDEFNSSKAKGTLYEGGINVPLIVSGAGVSHGEVTALVHTVDLFATIADIANITTTSGTDSISLGPYLKNPAQSALRSHVYTDGPGSGNGVRAVRDGQYKVIDKGNGTYECYDLINDPDEGSNLVVGGVLPAACQTVQALFANY